MKVQIGIAESNRVIELEVDDVSAFEAMLEDEFGSGTGLLWFEDTRNRRVGLPKARVAFIEIDRDEKRTAGFGG